MVNRSISDQVRDKIIEYYEQVLKPMQQRFCQNEEADKLVKENPLAFLLAVILDQGARAEIVWEIPFHLKKIMGHLDVSQIAAMEDDELYQVFLRLPQLPRYWKTAARRMRQACRLLLNKYGGQADHIWADNPRAGDLQSRLDAFEGIGQKKASMATRILGMDLGKRICAWNEMDVSYDVMIRRVFPRAGLCDTDSQREVIEAARKLYPSFPGILDYPCWDIGRRWCHPQHPNCTDCYISQVCPKIGV